MHRPQKRLRRLEKVVAGSRLTWRGLGRGFALMQIDRGSRNSKYTIGGACRREAHINVLGCMR